MPTIQMRAEKPVAFDSPDHIQPWGTANDNSVNALFNQKLFWWLPKREVSLLDIGCSGGGFVRSILDAGCLAVGVEGSDYSLKRKRAEWGTIPGNLFTADATAPFELTMEEGSSRELIKFSVVTAWEFIEHIAEPDLAKVMSNIDKHLAPHGVVIMSVSPNEEIINGVKLHQTVAEKPWWVQKFDSLGFTHHEQVVSFFERDWIRGEDNAPNSFHVVLTRKSESLPHPERVLPLTYLYSQAQAGVPWLTRAFVRQGLFARNPVVVVEAGTSTDFASHWDVLEGQVELFGLKCDGASVSNNSGRASKWGRTERVLPVALSDREGAIATSCGGRPAECPATLSRHDFTRRFPKGGRAETSCSSSAPATTLDALVASKTVSRPNFIKVETQGSELQVLHGAQDCLRDSVLGVAVEVSLQPTEGGAPTFESVRSFMAEHGFSLFDVKPEKWVRGVVASHDDPTTWTGRGQAVRAEVTFLRDLVPLLSRANGTLSQREREQVSKLATLAEVLGYGDYSVELLAASEKLNG